MNLSCLMTSESTDSRWHSPSGSRFRPSSSQMRAYEQYHEKNAPNSYFAPMTFRQTPQPPLSPPADEQRKCSLPSISSLLEGADSAAPAAKRHRPNPSQSSDHSIVGYRIFLPPTPPMRPGSGFNDGSDSPSASSSSPRSLSSAGSMKPFPSQLPSVATSLPTPKPERLSVSQESRIPSTPYASPTPSMGSFSSPVEPSGSHYRRPSQSSTYQTQNVAATTPVTASTHGPLISPVNPAWQHHHYFPPSSSAPYPQNHDRYVCRTCHKAFSRPSSLRIHSHSHTGEKPFRCTHVGCGKAFSVRSNMKRHERGCHTGCPVTATMV